MSNLLLLLVLVTAGCSPKPAEHRTIRVAAAADLTKAFTELAGHFKTTTGITVELQFGASGMLAKQIEQGVPFAMFAAANRSYIDQVVRAGRCDASTARSYALAICGTGGSADAARQFAAFVASSDGRELMTRYGFALPEDEVPSRTP